jgi:hypothetical protein
VEHTGVHQFELTDRDGVPHGYLVTEHPAGEGMDIMYALLGLGAPTVLGLAGAALRSEEVLGAVMAAFGSDAPALAGSDLMRMLAELDLSSVGAEVSRALGTGRAPELTRRVLSRTHRDGKPLAQHLDVAYQANYTELLQAVWKVCSINRFFPVPSTSQASSTGTRAAPTLAPAG